MSERFDDLTIVIPTLNEEANIGQLIEKLLSLYVKATILVVDDASEDRTAEFVDAISKKQKNVKLISRKGKQRGLSASIIDGLKSARTEFVVVMDGDGQHPAGTVFDLVHMLRKGCIIAVACRSSVPDWAFHRRIMSLGADLLGRLRLLTGNSPACSDLLSGFFGVERDFALEIYEKNEKRFVGEGYKFLFDLLKCSPKSTKVCEIDYIFASRKRGASKIGSRQCLAFLKSILS
ncbi:hypothetical protein DRN67_04475 [Candidatus Micrarchaeota archaeon]|nr:MAG: hypothetical protein DRN67_04475 [Candidatus Micrarchaeota archaeon]